MSRGQLHLYLLSRGCMRVIEDTLIDEVLMMTLSSKMHILMYFY